MSYELLALPVPPGAEIEEAGEALEVRLAGDHVFHDVSPAGAARRRLLAAVAAAADATLVADDESLQGRIVLRGEAGISVEIDPSFVVFRIAYTHDIEEPEGVFARLFGIVGAIVRETGWRVYDPQEAAAVSCGDDGRDATLEIYLSVLDQLRAGNGVRPR